MLFAGCYSSFRQPDSARSAVKILRHLGLEVGYLGEPGEMLRTALRLERRPSTCKKNLPNSIIPALTSAGAKRVVFICPSCYRTFKRDYQEALGQLPFDVIHITELVDQQLSSGTVKFTKKIDEFVTYHDPCHLSRQHLGRRQAVYDQPRNILNAIPGLSFAEISPNKKFALCCGNGALVTEPAFPEIAANMSSHIFDCG